MDLRHVLRQSRLDAATEAELARRARDGDRSARAELIRASLPLVAMRVFARRVPSDLIDDAFQAGVVGLIEAVDRFDPERGARLATWSWHWISGPIERCHIELDGTDVDIADVAAVDDPWEGLHAAIDVHRVMAGVDGLDRAIVMRRFGIGGTRPLSQAETAEALEVSLHEIRTRERRVLAHLGQDLGRVSDRAPH